MLSESEECFCVLRVYSRAVRTAWGMAPLDLRLSIPIWAIDSVQLVTSIASKGLLVDWSLRSSSDELAQMTHTSHIYTGKEFIIKFSPKSTESDSLGSTGTALDRTASSSSNRVVRSDSGASRTGSEGSTVLSEALLSGDLREMQLYADDANVS